MIPSHPLEVVEKDLHECKDKIAEKLHKSALEHGGSYLKSEHRDYNYKKSPFCYECGLLLILWVHVYLVIAAKSI